MGTLYATQLVFYQCSNWTEGASHGGSINTSAPIVSNTSQNIFDNVLNSERAAGDTEYRKIFFRNENTDSYPNAVCWIETNTPYTYDTIYIQNAGTKSQAEESVQLTGTATFTNGATIVYTSSNLTSEVKKGERVFNSTDDAHTLSATVYSVAATVIYLTNNYGGTSGSGKNISVAPATTFTYVQPTSITDADRLQFGTLAQNEYSGIWIKRVVTANNDGYKDNTFTIQVSDT